MILDESYEEIYISTDEIPLGQFLKLTNIFESGGFIKHYLREQGVLVNNQLENRRGRKLYVNDVVKITDGGTYIVVEERS